MRYSILLLSLCCSVAAYAAVVPLGEENDSNAPPAQKMDIPEKKQTPLLQPYITDKGERAELVTPIEGEQYEYAIVPIPVEHPDPLDDSSERNTDSEWQLLTW